MKKIILVCCLIFLSGCSIEYNLNITNDLIFEENIVVRGKTDDFSPPISEKFLSNAVNMYLSKSDNYELVNKFIEKNVFEVEARSLSKGLEDFKSKEAIGYFFSRNIYKNGDSTVFDVELSSCENEDCGYMEFDSITINITSDKKIVNSNADKIKSDGSKHTWYLTRSNIKDIYFELTDKQNYNYNYILIGLGIGVVFIIIVIIALILKKNKKVNEI